MRVLTVALLVASALGISIAALWLIGWAGKPGAMVWLGLVTLAATVTAVAWWRGGSLDRAATVIDRRGMLEDEAKSALDFVRLTASGNSDESGFRQLVVRRAASHLGELDLRHLLPIRPPRSWRWAALLALGLGLMMGLGRPRPVEGSDDDQRALMAMSEDNDPFSLNAEDILVIDEVGPEVDIPADALELALETLASRLESETGEGEGEGDDALDGEGDGESSGETGDQSALTDPAAFEETGAELLQELKDRLEEAAKAAADDSSLEASEQQSEDGQRRSGEAAPPQFGRSREEVQALEIPTASEAQSGAESEGAEQGDQQMAGEGAGEAMAPEEAMVDPSLQASAQESFGQSTGPQAGITPPTLGEITELAVELELKVLQTEKERQIVERRQLESEAQEADVVYTRAASATYSDDRAQPPQLIPLAYRELVRRYFLALDDVLEQAREQAEADDQPPPAGLPSQPSN